MINNDDNLKDSLFEEVKKSGLIKEEVKSTDNDFEKMISLLLHSRTQIHILHLQTKSYAEHKALNDYYDEIGDLVDGIVESYQGKYGIIKGYRTYSIDDYISPESTIKYMQGLDKKIKTLRKCCADSYIQNEIDNVVKLINSTLYKLKFLK